MLRTPRRYIATLSITLLLAPSVAGCMTTQVRPFGRTERLNDMSGLTTTAGRKISFVHQGAVVSNDTLYAVGHDGQLIVPTDSIASVSHHKVATGRTVGFVVGLAALTTLVAGIVAFGNSPLFSAQ